LVVGSRDNGDHLGAPQPARADSTPSIRAMTVAPSSIFPDVTRTNTYT
jgi:hypothetical protein